MHKIEQHSIRTHAMTRQCMAQKKDAFHRLAEGSASCYRASLQTTSYKDPVLSTILCALIRFVCAGEDWQPSSFQLWQSKTFFKVGPQTTYSNKIRGHAGPILEATREQNKGELGKSVWNQVDELVHTIITEHGDVQCSLS